MRCVVVRRLAGHKLNRITRRLARRGIFAVTLIRLLPVASFPKTNLVAGASYIRWRNFWLGTVLGIAPRIALTVVFVDRVRAAIASPGLDTFAILALVAGVPIGAGLLVWRLFGRDAAAATASPS